MKVDQLTTLRKSSEQEQRGSSCRQDSIFQIAAKEAGVADLSGALAGQIAVVTGQKDVSAAAKVFKTFAADNDKLKIKFGYLNNARIGAADIMTLADLPIFRSVARQDLGVINAPAQKLVTLINTPAS
ncbi:MAG: 50S ribosomal protein L10 [Verrucomicrobiota bacterium]